MPSRITLAAAAITMAFAAAASALARESEDDRDLGPGCAPERPAVAHRAGGVTVKNLEREQTAPIPCSKSTGWRTNEIGIVVTLMLIRLQESRSDEA